MPTWHAIEFDASRLDPEHRFLVMVGNQRALKLQVIAALEARFADDGSGGSSRFSGPATSFQIVADELRTVSMWAEFRLVLVEDADDFVKDHRSLLEGLVTAMPRKGILVLDVTTFPGNTKLAKLTADKGGIVSCTELKGAALHQWLSQQATARHGQKLARDAASLLIELVGDDCGLLLQELDKVAAYVGKKGAIAAEDVRALVTNWTTETTWAMTDAIQDEAVPAALDALDQLLGSGESPHKLLGGIAFVFRKLALATDLARPTPDGRARPLADCLREAGVFPNAISSSERYLRRLGRQRAEKIIAHLANTDAGIKGASRLPERIQMERLILALAGCDPTTHP